MEEEQSETYTAQINDVLDKVDDKFDRMYQSLDGKFKQIFTSMNNRIEEAFSSKFTKADTLNK